MAGVLRSGEVVRSGTRQEFRLTLVAESLGDFRYHWNGDLRYHWNGDLRCHWS